MRAPVPANEARRLAALRAFRILDTERESMFDDATGIASRVTGTPMATMSLVDAERQWFKARIGVEVSETPREISFCQYTILQDVPMIVEDASKDLRFADSPLVLGAPRIRFYAGAPLIDREGNRLGALCVQDTKPRKLDSTQSEILSALARSVIKHMELRAASAELAAVLEEVRTVRKLLPVCSYCRGVRDDEGYWRDVEQYLTKTNDLSHGICPECLEKHFPHIAARMRAKEN